MLIKATHFIVFAMLFISNSILSQVIMNEGKPFEGGVALIDGLAYRSNSNGQLDVKTKWADSAYFFSALHDAIYLEYSDTIWLSSDNQRIKWFPEFTLDDSLRGSYGEYRSNYDVIHYNLSLHVDVEKSKLIGNNTITLKTTEKLNIFQLDLWHTFQVDSIICAQQKLPFERLENSLFINFTYEIPKGEIIPVTIYYSGFPPTVGRFGGVIFERDSLNRPWVTSSCQSTGGAVWWPLKDQLIDEPDSMDIHLIVQKGLHAISNGRLISIDTLDKNTKWHWKVSYPINSYGVAFNVANYLHYHEYIDSLTLDYYVLDYHEKEAKKQFRQVKPMLECFQNKLGTYPFIRDGYKVVEVNYAGMEHQSAIAYGNGFENGYFGGDWTGVGVSTKFDFILIHESGHEWYGNSIGTRDYADAWIHEGWCTYTEFIYTECLFGKQEMYLYASGIQRHVKNQKPPTGIYSRNHWATEDIYFKGALFLHTLRHIIDNDPKWWQMIHDYTNHFTLRQIYNTDIINYFNDFFGTDLTTIFQHYLYQKDPPTLEFYLSKGQFYYRWKPIIKDFEMPLEGEHNGENIRLQVTTEWRSLEGTFKPATEKFYIKTSEIKP